MSAPSAGNEARTRVPGADSLSLGATAGAHGQGSEEELELRNALVEGPRGIPQCCCGRPECPFLAHSGQLLDGLEKDVQTAARMGQVSF